MAVEEIATLPAMAAPEAIGRRGDAPAWEAMRAFAAIHGAVRHDLVLTDDAWLHWGKS